MSNPGLATLFLVMVSLATLGRFSAFQPNPLRSWTTVRTVGSRSTTTYTFSSSSSTSSESSSKKGKILVLGGTGYLGMTVCQKAVLEGYSVVSLSRRGLPPADKKLDTNVDPSKIDYRKGDARQKESVSNILQEGGFAGVVHCIGLLFDDASGLGSYNRFVSGSGSLPDADSTYDTITRVTAFNAIDATIEYVTNTNNPKQEPFPFCFTSAAEAGWPDVTGGPFVESVMPDFIKVCPFLVGTIC